MGNETAFYLSIGTIIALLGIAFKIGAELATIKTDHANLKKEVEALRTWRHQFESERRAGNFRNLNGGT